MNLLLSLPVYLLVGVIEWWFACRRTLACARGEMKTLVGIVFAENLLGLFVLQSFIKQDDWLIAISYSLGGAIGAWIVTKNNARRDCP